MPVESSAGTSFNREKIFSNLRFVVAASSIGTLIDWYDFFVFGILASYIGKAFFPSANPIASLLDTFAAFAVGFLGRPLGGIIFGRFGDKVGRRYSFLTTILTMGIATLLLGLLPTYAQIGIAASILVFILRIIQGLGVGGEYGGAFIYIGENAPDERRGFYGSFLQITAGFGIVLAIVLSLLTRLSLGSTAFSDWGWRLPFVYAIFLVALAAYLRWRLQETPIYQKLREAGKTSKSPLKESLTSLPNWKKMLIGAIAGSAGVGTTFYTANLYSLSFLANFAKIGEINAEIVTLSAIVISAPFQIFFGWFSDRIGRKWLIALGYLFSAIIYFPVYITMLKLSHPPNLLALFGLVFVQLFFLAMSYGPMPAWFVEYFPARIRFTSLNFAWSLGVIIGGFQPFIATAIVAATHNPIDSLAYSVGVSLIAFIVAAFVLKETSHTKIWQEVEPAMQQDAKTAESKK
jgi:Nitrate/nitrite transporter